MALSRRARRALTRWRVPVLAAALLMVGGFCAISAQRRRFSPLSFTSTEMSSSADPALHEATYRVRRRTAAASRAVLTHGDASAETCTHTAAGPEWAVDGRGVLCPRTSLQLASGCCGEPNRGQFVCDGCEREASGGGVCCLAFEACVSCCCESAALHVCEQRCRTSSKSLGDAWNRYRSERKYCDRSEGAALGRSQQRAQSHQEQPFHQQTLPREAAERPVPSS